MGGQVKIDAKPHSPQPPVPHPTPPHPTHEPTPPVPHPNHSPLQPTAHRQEQDAFPAARLPLVDIHRVAAVLRAAGRPQQDHPERRQDAGQDVVEGEGLADGRRVDEGVGKDPPFFSSVLARRRVGFGWCSGSEWARVLHIAPCACECGCVPSKPKLLDPLAVLGERELIHSGRRAAAARKQRAIAERHARARRR